MSDTKNVINWLKDNAGALSLILTCIGGAYYVGSIQGENKTKVEVIKNKNNGLKEAFSLHESKRFQPTSLGFLPAVAKERKDVLSGSWSGYANQLTGIKKYRGKHTVQFIFKTDAIPISGHVTVEFAPNIKVDGKIINCIFDGKILKFDYLNIVSQVIHYGTAYLEVSSNGKKMEGQFLGWGMESQQFVHGELVLNK